MTVYDVDPNPTSLNWEDHWRELSQKGAMSFESYHKAKDGTLIPVELGLRFFSFSGEEFVARNLTERRQAEEDRQNFEQQLQQTQKLESLGITPRQSFSTVAGQWNNTAGPKALLSTHHC